MSPRASRSTRWPAREARWEGTCFACASASQRRLSNRARLDDDPDCDGLPPLSNDQESRARPALASLSIPDALGDLARMAERVPLRVARTSCRAVFGSCGWGRCVLREQERDRVAAERSAAAGREQRVVSLAVAFSYPFADDGDRELGELRPAAGDLNVRSGIEVHGLGSAAR